MQTKNMPPEECFTRALFGAIMIIAVFFNWGKWVTFVLGALFIVSAFRGYCVTCALYKKFIKPRNNGLRKEQENET